jgi:hypothetical protein
VEQHAGEVLLMMLEAAVVEGKGSMLRRLSSGDGILNGGLFIYLFRDSEERGCRDESGRERLLCVCAMSLSIQP